MVSSETRTPMRSCDPYVVVGKAFCLLALSFVYEHRQSYSGLYRKVNRQIRKGGCIRGLRLVAL